MTDEKVLFHNPEKLTDEELKVMRRKLTRQRLTTPLGYFLGVGSFYLIDKNFFNLRYTSRRPALLVVPGLLFMVAGS